MHFASDGSILSVKESWYTTAAARVIAEETHKAPAPDDEDGETSTAPLSTLERRLHTPAIHFVSEGRRGGFNKARSGYLRERGIRGRDVGVRGIYGRASNGLRALILRHLSAYSAILY